jgi:hypothetical protein
MTKTWFDPLRPALALLVLGIGVSCAAGQPSVVTLPDGLILLGPGPEPTIVDARHGSGQAPWRVAQWNAPRPLTRIDPACLAGQRAYLSTSPSASVVVSTHVLCQPVAPAATPLAGVGTHFEVSQSGSQLPCEMHGFPTEFDAFFAPEPSALRNDALTRPMTDMRTARHRISVVINQSRQAVPSDCRVNQNQAITSLVFSNHKRRQAFYYQLVLHTGGQPMIGGLPVRGPFWWATGKTGVGGWTSTKGVKRFGFQDLLMTFGLREPKVGATLDFDRDLLARLRQVVAEGRRHGMAQELSDWFLTGVYFGQSLWGRGELSTRWTGYGLDLTFAH